MLSAVVEHYFTEHETAERTEKVVGLLETEVECKDCGDLISMKPAIGDGELIVDSYCRDCAENNPLKSLLARPLSPEDIIDDDCTIDEDEESSGINHYPTCYGSKGAGHAPVKMYSTDDVEGDAYRCPSCRAVIVTPDTHGDEDHD